MQLEGIRATTLLLDERRARTRIREMAARVRRAGARFRPHFKTHQSAGIGEWFRAEGVAAATVSSLDMAEYFAAHGWADLTVAIPVNLRDLERLNRLAREVDLGVLVDSLEAARGLRAGLEDRVRVWIKVQCGAPRAGVPWEDPEQALAIARELERGGATPLEGLLAHFGDTYHARGADEVRRIYRDSLERLLAVRAHLAGHGFSSLALSVGDTPSCSLVEDFGPVDELRPGCFVFYDLQQLRTGACGGADLALAVACPVIGLRPERGQVVLHGGAVHLSADGVEWHGRRIHGLAAPWTAEGWGAPDSELALVSVSQEHGLLEVPPARLPEFRLGDLVPILPAHACLAANLHPEYRTLGGARVPRLHPGWRATLSVPDSG